VDSQDTEITLGTAKLLGLFFGLVIVCAVFFALGYTLGRKSDATLVSAGTAPLPATTSGPKPAGSASTQPAPPMTFYKAVEQKDANAQLTPATANTEAAAPATASQAPAAPSATQSQASQSASAPDPMTPIPTLEYFVQVAAVSKQDDAEALVGALKKKQYPAFVATGTSTDKLFRVQVGPFSDIKDAEGMRSRLINDGYSPILKK
jgi:cell division septation protein DedD